MDKKTLILGTIVGVVIGIAANGLALSQIQYSCSDCPVSYGMPLVVAKMGGYGAPQEIVWSGLVVDLLTFIVVGILLVAAYEALSRNRRRTRLK